MKRSIELLEVDALKPAVRNPKDHDLGELMTSIERFGFVDAVVLDERSGRLVAGHGRVEALQAMKKDGKPGLGRRCFAMEIHPPYVDIAVARWEAFTGKKATRLPAPG